LARTTTLIRPHASWRGKVKPPEIDIIGPFGLVLCAITVWAVSLRNIDLRSMNDIGLISVLPASFFVAFAVLTGSFCLTLHRRPSHQLLLSLHVVALLLILYATTTLVETAPRFESSWKHAGIAEYIMRNGSVDPTIDAYFSWPGFFVLIAFITSAAGFGNPISFAAWTPVALNFVCLGALIMILRASTRDARVVWTGAWFFLLTNWVGQDYFSPQGFAYYLAITILAILLTWFRPTPSDPGSSPTWRRPFGLLRAYFARSVAALKEIDMSGVGSGKKSLRRAVGHLTNMIYGWFTTSEPPVAPASHIQRIGAIAIIVLLFSGTVFSHQLTPFATIAGVTALVLCNRCSARSLPVLMAIILLTWISFMTVAFLAGNLRGLTSDVGQVNRNVSSAGVGRTAGGSQAHRFVVQERIIMTAAVWGLAFLGGIRRLWNGRLDLACAISAVVPFTLVALQSYGGEVFLRIYFFALPFMVFFIAALFYPTRALGASWRTAAAVGLVSLGMLGGFLVARYGNERMDALTSQEADAVQYLYRVAKPDSRLIAISYNLPWKSQGYVGYQYSILSDKGNLRSDVLDNADINAFADWARTPGKDAYVIVTESQKAELELFSGFPPDAVDHFEQALKASDQFRVIYSNRDATILVPTGNG